MGETAAIVRTGVLNQCWKTRFVIQTAMHQLVGLTMDTAHSVRLGAIRRRWWGTESAIVCAITLTVGLIHRSVETAVKTV